MKQGVDIATAGAGRGRRSPREVRRIGRWMPAARLRAIPFRVGPSPTVICLVALSLAVLLPVVPLPIPGTARASAPASSAGEYEVKSAYLINFARFVEWPDRAFGSEGAEIRIGVLGGGSFDWGLEAGIEARTVHGRSIRLVRLSSPAAAAGCHIVFVARDAEPEEARVLALTEQLPVLVVGETESFATRGGVVQFYPEDEIIRFEVNVAAAERRGLVISSKLLALARLTGSGPGAPEGRKP